MQRKGPAFTTIRRGERGPMEAQDGHSPEAGTLAAAAALRAP